MKSRNLLYFSVGIWYKGISSLLKEAFDKGRCQCRRGRVNLDEDKDIIVTYELKCIDACWGMQ